ncbi:hypothetical protein Taro_028728 [Colocasia esculenta]|uniref:GATA-type domain-containing protein n=1 Tax=Colocasia esculenta TaxID=4460 RepID=A0A843VI06_COLES|nr:hypothetical protein [Colocasia esculenta]
MDPGDLKVPSPIDPDGDWSLFQKARCCTDCRTTKTPLWRGGPSGPKSLCNACGIRYRKRRRELLGLQLGGGQKGKKERRAGSKAGVLGLLGMDGDVVLNQGDLIRLKQRCLWRRLDEEEKAAVLLMALSSGLIGA